MLGYYPTIIRLLSGEYPANTRLLFGYSLAMIRLSFGYYSAAQNALLVGFSSFIFLTSALGAAKYLLTFRQ